MIYDSISFALNHHSNNNLPKSIINTGARVITRDNNAPIVSLQFAVVGGSSSESVGEQGYSHFVSTTAYAGKSMSMIEGFVYFSILLTLYVMWSSALESPSLLSSYSIISLA